MTKTEAKLRIKFAPLALLSVAAAWGFSFVVMKDAIERQSVNSFLFSRFTLAVLFMVLIRPRVLRIINQDILVRGGLAGLFLGSGYIFQTLGLARTGAAITGFITGLYVVITPLLAALFLKEKISRFTWFCVLLATFGLAILSLHGWSIGSGETFVFISAILFAAHIIALSKWSSGRDVYAMTLVQLTTCALLTGIISFGQGFQAPPDAGVWWVVIFTAIFATVLAFIIQTWSQAHIAASKVAVILTAEVFFAALFAVVLGGEVLTFRISLGGAILVTAMYLIVTKKEK